jgi:methylphosphotriester-DNA--protein-cysteine methyltransferase
MINHTVVNDAALRILIKRKEICYGGNRKLKIYGLLQCQSGKRMKRENRVFFTSENEAIIHNYRPCGNCMRPEYRKWKDGSVQQ